MKQGGGLTIRRLILIMIAVVIIGLLIARSYYGNSNSSVDPRIREARELYESYDGLARAGDFQRIFALLDSIEHIYVAFGHYRNSFELGVLENNRAAALLTIALYRDSVPERNPPFNKLSTDSLVSLAEEHVKRAISIYENWNARYGGKTSEMLEEMTRDGFREGLESYEPEEVEAFHKTRIKEIEASVPENDRRLSVCYTNLGLVMRYRGNYQQALHHYEKALALWDRNLDAENNLNKLLNRPLKKRNFIQKMFPPERDN